MRETEREERECDSSFFLSPSSRKIRPQKRFRSFSLLEKKKAMERLTEDEGAASPASRRGGARSAAATTTKTTTLNTRRARKQAPPLASPPTGMGDIGDGEEENFLSLPEGGGGAGALDFSCSPIGAAAARRGDVAQPGASNDDLNMEVSPLRQQQQPKSATKVRRGKNGRDDEKSHWRRSPLHHTCAIFSTSLLPFCASIA